MTLARLREPVPPASPPLRPAALPPLGASPAGDLQHRVSDAVLRGFFAEPPVPVGYRPLRRFGIPAAIGFIASSALLGFGFLFWG